MQVMSDKDLDKLARLSNDLVNLGDKYMNNDLWSASAFTQSAMYNERQEKDVKRALGKVGLW